MDSIEDKIKHTVAFIHFMVDDKIRRETENVEAFDTSLKEDTLSYTMKWHGMRSLQADFELHQLRGLPERIKDAFNPKGNMSIEDLVSSLKSTREEAEYFLIHSRGWSPNSTGPVANVLNLAEGHAWSKIYEFLRGVLREIEVYQEFKSQLK